MTVYDTRSKFVAFTAAFETIYTVISEWGSLYVVCDDGKVIVVVVAGVAGVRQLI